MQRHSHSHTEAHDILKEVLGKADRESRKIIPPQRVLLMGTGALFDWQLGRFHCRELVHALSDAFAKGIDGAIVDMHWLGYPEMDAPFGAEATLAPIEYSAKGIERAVQRFPGAVIDFVCFSLSGIVVRYWAQVIAQEQDLRRINSITTINSPLQPNSILIEAVADYLATNQTLFGHPEMPPALLDTLDSSWQVTMPSKWNRRIYLSNIFTDGDLLAPPDLAVLNGGIPFRVEGRVLDRTLGRRRADMALILHVKALSDSNVHGRIIDTISTWHLAPNFPLAEIKRQINPVNLPGLATRSAS